MTAANVKNRRAQGGDNWVIGGRLSMDDGSTEYNLPLGVDFTIGAETGGNAITINIQFYADPQKTVEVGNIVHAPFYLTNSNSTLALGTAPSASLAAGTDGAIIETVDDLAGFLVSEADGDVDMVITDAGTPTFYIVVLLPDGRVEVSDAITFA